MNVKVVYLKMNNVILKNYETTIIPTNIVFPRLILKKELE